MANTDSRVTIHMAASLDGFIARKDGGVDWLETSDEFADGDVLDLGFVQAFLRTIDCYVMGSRTYETALNLEAKGLGWPYGDKPVIVLTSRDLPRTSATLALCRRKDHFCRSRPRRGPCRPCWSVSAVLPSPVSVMLQTGSLAWSNRRTLPDQKPPAAMVWPSGENASSVTGRRGRLASPCCAAAIKPLQGL